MCLRLLGIFINCKFYFFLWKIFSFHFSFVFLYDGIKLLSISVCKVIFEDDKVFLFLRWGIWESRAKVKEAYCYLWKYIFSVDYVCVWWLSISLCSLLYLIQNCIMTSIATKCQFQVSMKVFIIYNFTFFVQMTYFRDLWVTIQNRLYAAKWLQTFIFIMKAD